MAALPMWAQVAVAVANRPSWAEVVGIVLGCAVLLVVLTKLDRAAYEREMSRARAVLAERAAAAAARPGPRGAGGAVAATARTRGVPRTESLGARGPIAVPLGGAWGAGTATAVARVDPPAGGSATAGSLRRIVGPVSSAGFTPPEPERRVRPRTAAPGADPAPARPTAPAPGHGTPLTTLLAIGLGAVGSLMALTGAVLLGRGRSRLQLPAVGVTR